jgi:group II intron reverse transcriptase/maturase
LKDTRLRQLTFAFADSPQGGKEARPGDESSGKAYLLHKVEGKNTHNLVAPAAGTARLLEQVASEPNLAKALLAVFRNKGAPGVDGRSVEEVVEESRRLLPRLRRNLLEGSYRPGDIRRVWIPKSGGGQRGLGIPNVVDRWVQQAVFQVLEPIFEPTFHPSSHGFRPGRGAHTAIAEAARYVREGYEIVVDIDLSKFFDRVNHQRLLSRLGQHVADPRILTLVRRMLKAEVVMPDGARVATEEGTPQGGPLSPLLSNIVLNEFDWKLQQRKLRFVRYADDCNIFVRSERAGQRVMDSTRRFLEGRLRLRVNEEKSKVARPEEIHFLGFRLKRIPGGDVEVHISRRSKDRLAAKIRELTPRNWGKPARQCIEGVNRYIQGWMGYFRICTEGSQSLFKRFDAHIRRRIRALIVRQRKRPRHLYRHLVQRGVSVRSASAAAYDRRRTWWKSNARGVTQAYPNVWFAGRLKSLWGTWCQLNPPPTQASGQLLLFDLWDINPKSRM